MAIDWKAVFTTCSSAPPATDEDLRQLAEDLRRPLSPREIETVNAEQRNPFNVSDPLAHRWRPFDAALWCMPSGQLPPSYESFLRTSNGGPVRTGAMEFSFFATHELRGMMLGYHLPEYMPMAIPLGLDGSGNFVLFDARAPLRAGEYPVLFAAAGNLCFEDARLLSTSFEGFCRRTERLEAAFDVPPLQPPSEHEIAERNHRLAARSAELQRTKALALADQAFSRGEYARVVELLSPYRATLVGSVELKLRMAEKKGSRS